VLVWQDPTPADEKPKPRPFSMSVQLAMALRVQTGEWNLTDAQAEKLRDYLLRGGFSCATIFGDQITAPSSSRA